MCKQFNVYRDLYVDLMGRLTIMVKADAIDVTDNGIKKIHFYRDGKEVVYFPYGYVEQVSYWPAFKMDRVNIDL